MKIGEAPSCQVLAGAEPRRRSLPYVCLSMHAPHTCGSRLLADGGVVLLDRLIEAGLGILVLEDYPVDRVLPRVLELAVVGRGDQRPSVRHVRDEDREAVELLRR